MEILTANNVCKTFGTHVALNNVNISIPQNSIYGLLGPNGAGKTTFIRIINQILAPDSGQLLFKGNKLSQADVALIGYLPEERGLYKKMKVGEQALYLARLKGMSKTDALKKLKFWFEKLEIQAWWGKKVEELSKGMQQKVQFISTIVHSPELLVFDEPFSGFDPINANMLKNEILDLKANGATIIFSTHNMASVEELCDNITLINKSEVILAGEVDEIRNRYKTGLFEIKFAGNPEIFRSRIVSEFEVHEIKSNHIGYTAMVKEKKATSDNTLLKLILPDFHILSFQEILPGMNEVFIKLVQEN